MGKTVEESKKPKGKMTAYFMFMKEMRPDIAKSNPGLKITEIAKLMGAKWRELTTEDKAEFSEKARVHNEAL
jgi:hypothetical protein